MKIKTTNQNLWTITKAVLREKFIRLKKRENGSNKKMEIKVTLNTK